MIKIIKNIVSLIESGKAVADVECEYGISRKKIIIGAPKITKILNNQREKVMNINLVMLLLMRVLIA